MADDHLSGVTIFLRIAEARSFTAAASSLGLSPSAASQSVRHLERKLGVRLLNRTTRSVSLTDAGERLLERVRPAIEELRSALGEVGSLAEMPTGTLRLNVSRTGYETLSRLVSTSTQDD